MRIFCSSSSNPSSVPATAACIDGQLSLQRHDDSMNAQLFPLSGIAWKCRLQSGRTCTCVDACCRSSQTMDATTYAWRAERLSMSQSSECPLHACPSSRLCYLPGSTPDLLKFDMGVQQRAGVHDVNIRPHETGSYLPFLLRTESCSLHEAWLHVLQHIPRLDM